jgi:hypothetical protein
MPAQKQLGRMRTGHDSDHRWLRRAAAGSLRLAPCPPVIPELAVALLRETGHCYQVTGTPSSESFQHAGRLADSGVAGMAALDAVKALAGTLRRRLVLAAGHQVELRDPGRSAGHSPLHASGPVARLEI